MARTAANLILAVPASSWIKRQSVDIVYTNTISICLGAWAGEQFTGKRFGDEVTSPPIMTTAIG